MRWSPQLKQLRVLSVRQPWAWLIVNGYKDIENRSWRTNHRGPLLIHASSNRRDFMPEKLAEIRKKHRVRVPADLQYGGIVGLVDVIDCVKTHSSKWKFKGSWGWVLEKQRRLPYRQCKGSIGFFKLKSHPI